MNKPTYTELEAQQSDLLKLHNALAANQPIWPNNWNQQVAMIAYHFHLMQAQLADAKQVANDCRIVADNAIAEALGAKKDAERLDFVLIKGAFLMQPKLDHPIPHYQLLMQDEDEGYHTLSGDLKSFETPRLAIDAAIQAEGKA